MKKEAENQSNEAQAETSPDVKQLQPKPQARFVGTVVKLNDRTEEVVQYPKGQFTINYAPYYLEATETKTGVITRLPYTSIHFTKEVQS